MKLPALLQIKKTRTNTETKSSTQTVNVSPTAQDLLVKGLVSIKDIIAPEAIEVDFSYLKIGPRVRSNPLRCRLSSFCGRQLAFSAN